MIRFLPLHDINAPYHHDMLQAAAAVMERGQYLRGEATQRFERHYANYIGSRYCIGCGNGLDALTLILRAYKELGVLKEGDEVLVPANTYIATMLAITENGLKVVGVEPDGDTLQLDERRILPALTPRTKALVLVHLYGQCAYTSGIGALCKRYGLLLIEDNAQAQGACFEGVRTGNLGHAAAHSFYPTKNLGALGDAGAVTTNDEALAQVVRALGNYGSGTPYHFAYKGRNSRMDELQAAMLDVKLAHLDTDNARRRQVAYYYLQHIQQPLLTLPTALRNSVWHIFPVLSTWRQELQQHLAAQGIETLIHYPIPPHKQPCYATGQHQSFPITERIHREELSLPCHPQLSPEECRTIVAAVNAFKK